jgi:hypothetical protein
MRTPDFWNVAVQILAAVIVTVPSLQSVSPLQPAKVDPAEGVAVRVTAVPLLYEAIHVEPQVMPVGLLVTVPAPEPVLLTVSEYVVGGRRLNVAVQVLAVVMVTEPSLQSASPLQPANVEPAAGVTVRVTVAPLVYEAVQVAPQLMPAGLLLTAPLPVPAFVMVRT